MAKTKKPKKHYPTDIPLAENVRILKCGAWGYILNQKAIFYSEDVNKVNSFSKWARSTKNGDFDNPSKVIIETAKEWQKLEGEPKILPQCHLCDAAIWRVEGNNYASQIKMPTFN